MAKKPLNDHAEDHESAHEHEGSSVGFYIFIALVLGVITYIEFALIEYQEAWFGFLGPTSILIWLIVLSVVKFFLVVMFFMHLQQDDRTFTGFFTSGMVIAVGTLIALSALFTVRSLATAQTPQEEQAGAAHGEQEAAEGHGVEVAESSPAHRFEYPAPKTLDEEVIDLTPPGQLAAGASVADTGAESNDAATPEGEAQGAAGRTEGGLPLAAPPPAITLPDPFSPEAQAAARQDQTQDVAPTGEASGAEAGGEAAAGDPAAGEALFVGALGCVGCHGEVGVGGVGPNLTDAEWIYGGDAASISETLHNGRPGGMPAFGAQASEEDIANLVAYVMSLGGAQGSAGGE
jgi:mono/diheme cytochrome c family protein/heme/copper-type cytochrome/quinol oxidase subunit 4